MKNTSTISRILYYISSLLALGFFLTTFYTIICLIGTSNVVLGEGGKHLDILFPFTREVFLTIDRNPLYLFFGLLLPLSLYSIFFWSASRVCKVFFQPKLFTQRNIRQLQQFYWLNIIGPVATVWLISYFIPLGGVVWLLVLVHLFLGAITYFLTSVFKQALLPQNGQELIK